MITRVPTLNRGIGGDFGDWQLKLDKAMAILSPELKPSDGRSGKLNAMYLRGMPAHACSAFNENSVLLHMERIIRRVNAWTSVFLAVI